MQIERSFAPTAKPVGDSVSSTAREHMHDIGFRGIKLNKGPERILDPANGKPCQRQCRVMASEYIRGLLMGNLHQVAERMLDRANDKPCQRQFRMMACEYMCGLLIGSVLSA